MNDKNKIRKFQRDAAVTKRENTQANKQDVYSNKLDDEITEMDCNVLFQKFVTNEQNDGTYLAFSKMKICNKKR